MIALTGGTGFLGSHIADALLAAGHQVRVAVRATSNLQWLADKPLETRVVNLADVQACVDFLAGTRALIHCSGVVSGPDEAWYQQGNVQPTACLAAAADLVWAPTDNAAFVLISSLAAHGPAPLRQPAVETDPCRPITAYGRSKRDAEEALRAGSGSYRKVMLRPPALYGPRDREFLPLLRAARRGWTVRLGHSLTGLSLVDGRDAAGAVLALLDCATGEGPFFVSDRQIGYDWDSLQASLARAVERPVHRITIPLGLVRGAAGLSRLLGERANQVLSRDRLRDLDCPGWVCDGSRLTSETGFRAARTAEVGLRETLDFYLERRWL